MIDNGSSRLDAVPGREVEGDAGEPVAGPAADDMALSSVSADHTSAVVTGGGVRDRDRSCDCVRSFDLDRLILPVLLFDVPEDEDEDDFLRRGGGAAMSFLEWERAAPSASAARA